ncbi:MAG: hypothetical protein Q4E05_04375 [Pseudoclavibacter sp.]|nr:hypothetical protein [Pseudoclavibacter sp.]
MPLMQKARALGVGLVAAGMLTTGAGLALPFATGAYRAPTAQSTEPDGEDRIEAIAGGQLQTAPSDGPAPDEHGQSPLEPDAEQSAANEALVAGLDPLNRCLWRHGVSPQGMLGPWQDPSLPYDDREPADRAVLTLRAELLRHHPGEILEVVSDGDAAGSPGLGPVRVVVPEGSPLSDAELPVLAEVSSSALGALQTLSDLGVPVSLSASAAGSMVEICALEDQIEAFAAAQPLPEGGEGAEGTGGFGYTARLDPQAGVLLVTTTPDYAPALRESLASVGAAFVVDEVPAL